MAKLKSRHQILAGILSLGGVFLLGCGTFNLFNNDFLNQFQPLGQTSLNTIQAKGPVTLVLENLTVEADHQETALFTINYVDAQGVQQVLTPQTPLKAVPTDQRDPTKANFNPAFRQVYILDCGVKEIWFSGQVFRTQITNKTTTVTLINGESASITYCTASITKSVANDGKVTMTTNTFDTINAVQVPPFHLLEKSHFQCGDVIVVGLLDQQTKMQMLDPMVLTCDYTDVDSLSQTVAPTVLSLVFNPTHSLLLAEYQYPVSYVIIPIVLPNMAGVDTVLPVMQKVAAENAGKVTDTDAAKSR